jgi:hypothetical protein
MSTFREINKKISELRSKIAVAEGLVLYLKTHYLPHELTKAPAEMHFTRDDYGRVPYDHIASYSVDLVDHLDTLKYELNQLEESPTSQVPQEKEIKMKTKTEKAKGKKGEHGTEDRSKDQSPSGD